MGKETEGRVIQACSSWRLLVDTSLETIGAILVNVELGNVVVRRRGRLAEDVVPGSTCSRPALVGELLPPVVAASIDDVCPAFALMPRRSKASSFPVICLGNEYYAL